VVTPLNAGHWILGSKMLVVQSLENSLGWAPSLDRRASFARKPLARKKLDWFERTAL
jgi:hypothetical protein